MPSENTDLYNKPSDQFIEGFSNIRLNEARSRFEEKGENQNIEVVFSRFSEELWGDFIY